MLLRRKSEKIEMLRKVPMFADLSGRAISQIASVATERTRAASAVLTEEGAPGLDMFVLLQGKARVERGGKRLAWLGSGDCFGEMSLIDYEPRSATVIANTDVTLLVVNTRAFQRLMKEPAMANAVLRVLSGRLRRASAALAKVN